MTNEEYCNICMWLIDNREYLIQQYRPHVKNFKIHYSYRTNESNQIKIWQRSKLFFMNKLKYEISELKPHLTMEDILIVIEDPYLESIVREYYLEDLLWA